jgi:hypothetical protein
LPIFTITNDTTVFQHYAAFTERPNNRFIPQIKSVDDHVRRAIASNFFSNTGSNPGKRGHVTVPLFP